MAIIPTQLLKDGASQLGIELTDHQLWQFDTFASMLLEANRQMNLTRITEPADMVTKHFLDSLLCLSVYELQPESEIVDVGTGAGFPGIPIKIARPDIHMTLIDSTMKKIKFVADVVRALGFRRVSVLHARAEELAHDLQYRERFDTAYARALAELRVLAELCLPFVQTEGILVATKGPRVEMEIADAKDLIGRLGGVIEKTVCTQIPNTNIRRTLIVIRKEATTPKSYPRPYAKISTSRAKSGRD